MLSKYQCTNTDTRRENANAQAARDRDETQDGRYAHMFQKKKICFIQNNRDSYKGETNIPPPHPHKKKILIISLTQTQRIHIFAALQNDKVVNVFILNTENMTVLHVYTYIHTYSKMVHTHTQKSYRMKRHKCCHDKLWRCRKTDESLMKALQVIR
jgi:hypothetical protein